MLGLRKVAGCQVDLHQGDLARFVCDALVAGGADQQLSQPSAQFLLRPELPMWQGGTRDEERLLAAVFRESLRTAAKQGARHVALPALGTGPQGFPIELVAPLAMATVKRFAEEGPRGTVARITFVLPSAASYETFQRALFSAFPEGEIG